MLQGMVKTSVDSFALMTSGMSEWFKVFLAALVLTPIGYVVWEWYWIELPVERTMRDGEGREYPALVIGKSKSHVRLRKSDDDQIVDIPLGRLSEKDQMYLARVRDRILPALWVDLPVERTLHDSQYRPLRALILAKSATHLRVKRVEDGRLFDIPLEVLADADLGYLDKVRATSFPPIPGPELEFDPRIVARQKEIHRLKVKISILQAEIKEDAAGELGQGIMIDRRRKLEVAENDISELEAEIELIRLTSPGFGVGAEGS